MLTGTRGFRRGQRFWTRHPRRPLASFSTSSYTTLFSALIALFFCSYSGETEEVFKCIRVDEVGAGCAKDCARGRVDGYDEIISV